ncbi:MAG: TVP38/TMEM64 family protein [Deltaproteobacteria bacterium]|nr:TVP38/TMEM64 family protein [Deltaproteobacteria bacterium]MBW2393273.1 TVP38/TMEM64 family protein [Deltaproteobacteria bacterium]
MNESTSNRHPLLRRLLGLAALALLLGIPFALRRAAGIELNVDSIREFVSSLGVWGPLVMVLIVTFRTPLLLTSQIVLTVAGVCFGALEGALYGALGSFLSGFGVFVAVRWLGADAIAARVPPNLQRTLQVAGSRGTAALMAIGTAVPVGPTTLYHAAAGLTKMGTPTFIVALVIGVIPRSLLYAAFGSSLLEGRYGNAAWLGVVILLPFLALIHPGARAWFRYQFAPALPSEKSASGDVSEG